MLFAKIGVFFYPLFLDGENNGLKPIFFFMDDLGVALFLETQIFSMKVCIPRLFVFFESLFLKKTPFFGDMPLSFLGFGALNSYILPNRLNILTTKKTQRMVLIHVFLPVFFSSRASYGKGRAVKARLFVTFTFSKAKCRNSDLGFWQLEGSVGFVVKGILATPPRNKGLYNKALLRETNG